MPHLTIDYTVGLHSVGTSESLRTFNTALVATGHFEEAAIKSRSHLLEDFAIGTATTPRGFVHAKLAILSGRTAEVKQSIAESLLQAVRARCESTGIAVQVCVEVMDIDRPCYAKTTYGP